MLQEQEQIRDAPGAPFFDKRSLQDERVLVRHDAEPPDLNRTHYTWFGSKCSRFCLMSAMN
jgi:hypothetical protein